MNAWIPVVQNAFCVLAALLLLGVLLPEKTLVQATRDTVRALSRDRGIRRVWLVYLAVIGCDLLLNTIDPWFTAWVGHDFTPLARALDNGVVQAVQHLVSPAGDVFMTVIYVAIFPQAIVASLLVFTVRADLAALRQLVAAVTSNYVLAIPFYLFVPVNEAWSFDSSITLRMDAVSPLLMEAYRPLSGIDNCFPSLHTSLGLTAFLVAMDRRSVHPRLAPVVGAIALLSAVSTLYLGIHWSPDVVAGVGLAVVCHRISVRVARPVPEMELIVEESR